MAPTRPVLRWFGGKWILADWIISHFPEHRVYVEPFGGAGSVLMKKPRSYAEVWNDLDDSVWSLFKCLQTLDTTIDLRNSIEATPYARREFELAHVHHPDPVEKARRLIVRSFMGFGADSASNLASKTGFRSNSNRLGTTPAHDWINYPAQLNEFHNRLKGVIVENKDAFDLMLQHDGEKTLHYLDPPYTHDTRRSGRYKHEMSMDEHRKLIDFVKTMKGHVIISGYDNPLYDELGWEKKTRKAFADGAAERTEVLWIKPGAHALAASASTESKASE